MNGFLSQSCAKLTTFTLVYIRVCLIHHLSQAPPDLLMAPKPKHYTPADVIEHTVIKVFQHRMILAISMSEPN